MINTITKHRNTEQLSWHTRSAATNRDALKSDVTTRVKSSVNKNVNRGMKETAEINFCGLSSNNKLNKISNWFYNSNRAKEILKFADDNQPVFGAGFALILTGIFRPASIMVLPSKKNKDDQKYASAHSIASGVIGFAISSLILSPFAGAAKKLSNNISNYINKDSYLLKDKDAKKTAELYLKRLPDIAFSIPKGLLTIALIPPILKYCFGWEKKKGQIKNNEKLTTVDYSLLNFKSKKKDDAFLNFKGGTK